MKELHPDLQSLRERRQTEAGAYHGAEGGAESDDPEAGWEDALSDLDLSTLDLGALDGLDGALSAIDAAAGSGGDGGGGGGS